MSVLNNTLKAIEQRQDTAEHGLEPTVALRQGRDMPRVLGYCLAAVLAVGLVAAAYLLIPQRQSEPLRPLAVAAAPQQVKTQKGASPQPLSVTSNSQEPTLEVVEQHVREVAAPKVEAASQPQQAIASVTNKSIPSALSTPSLAQASSAQTLKGETAEERENKPVVIKSLNPEQRAERWFVQGQQSLNYGMMDEAISQFEQALALAPDHVQARTLMAATLYGQSRVEDAYALLIKGLERQPAMLKWRVLIAKMATEQQQYARVLAVLDQPQDTLALQADNNDYWILKGTAARQLQQDQIARDCFTLLVQRQPTVAKWWLALAGSEEALGASEQAKEHYGKAIRLGGLSKAAQEYARARYISLQGGK